MTPVVAMIPSGSVYPNTFPVVVSGTNWNRQIDGLVEGANTLVVTATDAAGNVTTQTVTIYRDNVPPFLTISVDMLIGITSSRTARGTAEIGSTITVFCGPAQACQPLPPLSTGTTGYPALINRQE